MARNPQIRDCQWVCHTVDTVLPHYSPTKAKPRFVKKIAQIVNFNDYKDQNIAMHDIYEALDGLILIPEDAANLKFKEQTKAKLFLSHLPKQTKQDFKILAKIRDIITDFGIKRMDCDILFEAKTKSVLKMLEEYKLGNCYEDATLAKIIMELNGINNVKVVNITEDSDKIIHAVCIFNRDGSPLKLKDKDKPELGFELNNNNTIIIDPWTGKCDFANNMISYYRNTMQKHFLMPSVDKLKFVDLKIEQTPNDIIEILRVKYPQFTYPERTRKFMSTK